MDDFLRKVRFVIAASLALGCIAAGLAWDSAEMIGLAFVFTFAAGGVGGLICAYAEPPTD